MKVSDLVKELNLTVFCGEAGLDAEISGGYTSDQILQALDVHLEENIFSFDPTARPPRWKKCSPCWRISGWSGITPAPWWCG